MQSIKSILIGNSTSARKPLDKHLSWDFQALGIRIADELDDQTHKSLYIKLAKTHDAKLLEEVLSFVSDSEARNKGALFMWKLKKIKEERERMVSKPIKH